DVEAAPEPHRAHVALPDGESGSRRPRVGDIALRVVHAPALADGGGEAFEEPCGAASNVHDGRGRRGEMAGESRAAHAPPAIARIGKDQAIESRLLEGTPSPSTVPPSPCSAALGLRSPS